MGYRAIVFDLDGVLWDSTGAHRQAFEEIFTRYEVKGFHYHEYAGQRTREVLVRVLGGAGIETTPEELDRLSQEKTLRARELLRTGDPVRPGVSQLLPRLAERVRLGLASSGSRGSVRMFLEMSGTLEVFEVVLTGDDVKQAKPDPEIYRLAAAGLQIAAEEILVVEDAVSGIQAARSAGSDVVGLVGTEEASTLIEAGASRTINSLEQLFDVL